MEYPMCKHKVWGEEHLNTNPDRTDGYCSAECEDCDTYEGERAPEDMCMDCYVGTK